MRTIREGSCSANELEEAVRGRQGRARNRRKRRRKIERSRRKEGQLARRSARSTPLLPPWLSGLDDTDVGRADAEQTAFSKLQRLKLALNGIFYDPVLKESMARATPFTQSDIDDILDSVRVASNGDLSLASGCAEFLLLMLSLEEEGTLNSDLMERWEGVDSGKDSEKIMTRDLLIAATFHYCDCVRARNLGVYDFAKQTMEGSIDKDAWAEIESKRQFWLPDDRLDLPDESSMQVSQQPPIFQYGEASTLIAAGAARIKKGEIMAMTVKQPLSDAEILRSFLISVAEDWRALVIRSSACLYRLRGIARAGKRIGATPGSYNQVGREALKEGGDLTSMAQVLTTRMEQLLRSDDIFISQIEDVSVNARVKEPYSLWRKMLRYRKEMADMRRNCRDEIDRRPTLSLKWVPDTLALRVVLSAMRLSRLEDDESLRTREKMLCFYALQLISDVWPSSMAIKDYITNPKKNGYQSLHYSASMMIGGEEWPFEVQVRSEEMHKVAEYGEAAHWDYKTQTKASRSLPEANSGSLPALSQSSMTDLFQDAQNTTSLGREGKARKKSRIASYIDSLASSRDVIVENNLFIFVSTTDSALDGKIVSVDPGLSSITDLLDSLGVDLGEDDLHIYKNGIRVMTLDDKLCNGDVVTIPKEYKDKII
ncbi:hypothetical protein THAOC_36147 [Thalassiosira oceanica]|uniref:RelA/SpoT domain-containing protein n=1 Tax=Thalassiosira oceanica TaxID=159749 RepID=K0R292_THAOC|nr:hypothetical protein THAOC_36147 [Thalassiosira oceanica]|eukprot:EJK45244.1 hypothetical protein THAOC_36147 [Thalassiosira oceanica]